MKQLRKFFVITFQCFSFVVIGQTRTVAGYVTDASSGETMIGATVSTADGKKGTVTNQYGYYCLTLPEGETEIVASFVSYGEQSSSFTLRKDTTINFRLIEDNKLEEVVVTAEVRRDNRLKETLISKEIITPEILNSLPSFLGETDVVKTVQMLPGVQSGSEGSTGLYVRGGAPDQNLVLLDDVPIYNANHLFGFFSVFNTDAIKNVSLHKGGFPARFGGRLSSVLDIHTKDGNEKQLHGNAQIGLLSSKFTLEGPIKKEKTTFLISARRTYFDIFTGIVMPEDEKFNYHFWDINAKINHKISDKNRLFISAYGGRDIMKIRFNDDGDKYRSYYDNSMGWGNVSAAIRWNCLLRNNLFMNTTASFAYYNFNVGSNMLDYEDGVKTQDASFDYTSLIRDWSIKNSFNYTVNDKNTLKFGEAFVYHTFRPGVETYRMSGNLGNAVENSTQSINEDKKPIEANLFVEDEVKFCSKLNANIGVHTSLFHVDDKTYTSLEPRISLASEVSEKVTVKTAYSRMKQYLHLLTNGTVGMPTDLWVPVTGRVKPLESQQVAVGVVTELPRRMLLSLEGYYKDMKNIIEYKDGASFYSQAEWEDKVDMGDGRSYGVEFMLKKDVGKTTGWIAYTWSKSERLFDNINGGQWFPATYDRRHDISIVVNHKFSDKVDMGATWVFGTGNAMTLATHSIVTSDGFVIDYVTGRNNYRMPNFHRLDLGLNIHRFGKRLERTLSVSVYNLYNRHNPYMLYFSREGGKRKLMQMSIFPIIPSVAYSIKF